MNEHMPTHTNRHIYICIRVCVYIYIYMGNMQALDDGDIARAMILALALNDYGLLRKVYEKAVPQTLGLGFRVQAVHKRRTCA